jgi:hypothetical protein
VILTRLSLWIFLSGLRGTEDEAAETDAARRHFSDVVYLSRRQLGGRCPGRQPRNPLPPPFSSFSTAAFPHQVGYVWRVTLLKFFHVCL